MLLFFILFLFIAQLNSCPLTDDYLSRCQCGILTNGESYIKCDEHSLHEIPQFKRSFPYDELNLANNYIQTLPASAFDNIKTIRRINLQNNALSSIDEHLLRLLGNYLEELSLTGDDRISSLEFLTRYPLKKLRVLKLDHFNLGDIDLKKTFRNMTKLEIVSLRSCQLKQIPNLEQISILNLEQNLFSNTIFLSTSYSDLNLANNQISSIILQNNKNLISLNMSHNQLKEFYSLTISNNRLNTLDLSFNQLTFIDWTMFSDSLVSLNLSSNSFTNAQFKTFPKSLLSLDLSSNQLKTLEKNSFFSQLNVLNLNHNPFNCNCQLKWLQNLTSTAWVCSSSDFQCQTMPQVRHFNITYMTISSETGLWIEWIIDDKYHAIDYLQISIESPYRLSERLRSNRTHVFISNGISLNKYYHICLILVHRYARDKYCRNIRTKNPMITERMIERNERIFHPKTIETTTTIKTNDFHEKNLYLLMIGSCIGGLLTFFLLLTCCYLCYQIRRYRNSSSAPVYEKCSQHFHPYPMYHSHSTCPHHQVLYNSENLSNSTDSSHMDTSLSTTNNTKHIYQTIDSQDYHSFKRQQHHQQVFELWNQSLKQKR